MLLIRLGFVTNSSSTTHIMMWKGEKDDLISLLEAHRDHFNLRYVTHKDQELVVTPEMVAEAVKKDLEGSQPASIYAREHFDLAEDYRKLSSEEDYSRSAEDLARRASMHDWVLEMEYGDETEDPLGLTMDYEGRRIRIVDGQRGFYYTTRSNR